MSKIRKRLMIGLSFIICHLSLSVTLTSCNPEPDESDLYTFTGETIESFIAKDSTLTSFNYILSRVGYDKMLAAYGSYTCFAPTNDGVAAYIDSLYNDSLAAIPHNGMTDNSLEGLSDSLCRSIARFHITNQYRDIVSMTDDNEILTLLGYEFSYSSKTGQTVLGGKATILSSDNTTVNGLVHIIDNVIPRTAKPIGDILEQHTDMYSIFSQALQITGLADSLTSFSKGVEFEFKQLPRESYSGVLFPSSGVGTTGVDECKVGYTLFAETDEVMRKNGINSLEDLIAYANKVYADAPEWYNYMNEHHLTVSTGNDYTNRFNALNMFVAYHILNASMSANQLVFEKGSSKYWNYAPDADPYDYYETLLPHTIMKIWEPHTEGKRLYINRYQTYNTLTNEVGSPGTNHELILKGISIDRNASLQAGNAYIHSIGGMLVYNADVPKKVLNERMRVNCTSLFPELINNKFRYYSTGDGNIPSTHDGSRRGIPKFYFDNMVLYNDEVCLCYCLHGAWRCFQSDQMQFWGRYDLAFKLPSVPSGLYELRVVYAPMSYGSFMQYYIGTSSNLSSMLPIGLPFDATVNVTDPRVGLTDAINEDDRGIATDISMRNRGYMRGPYSYCGHAENGWSEENNSRNELIQNGSLTVRYVLGRVQLKQGDENWLRIKSLNFERNTNPVGLDFVEIVPVSVVDNQLYTEDWY